MKVTIIAALVDSLVFGGLSTGSLASASTSCDGLTVDTPGRVVVSAQCSRPGERLRWRNHEVPVPKSGEGVSSHSTNSNGLESEFEVRNEDGLIEISRRGMGSSSAEKALPMSSSSLAAAVSPSACADSANSWTGTRNNGWTYRVDASGLPSGVTSGDFLGEISTAESGLESGYNDCGKPQGGSLFSLEMSRGPDVTAEAMTSTGGCVQDNVRIVDFGPLTDAIGRACTFYTILPFADDTIYEADVRLLRSPIWFRLIPSGCVNKYEMSGVLTHEFGHAFGFGHVAEDGHGRLTMSQVSTPCSYADRSLGLGDYNMLNDHY